MKTIIPTIGLFLIVGLLGLYFGTQSAQAQRTGPYMLVAHSNETANVGIFRVDTSSGAVSFCFLDNGGATVRCTAAAS